MNKYTGSHSGIETLGSATDIGDEYRVGYLRHCFRTDSTAFVTDKQDFLSGK